MKILISMSKIFPPNLKTAQLKQIDPITLVSNLLLYFIGTTIDVFTIHDASLYNLIMSNYSVFNFLYLILKQPSVKLLPHRQRFASSTTKTS